MNSLQKGAIGLAHAIYHYQKHGFIVSIPLVDAQLYDLVIEKDGCFQSVQVKYTCRPKTGIRSSRTNTKGTVDRKRQDGDYDILFVSCKNGDGYSIPEKVLPNSEVTLTAYSQYKV